MNTFNIRVYETEDFGIMCFRENLHVPSVNERRTNELFDIFGIVARCMALDKAYGTANVVIENGKHAGKKLTVTIGLNP